GASDDCGSRRQARDFILARIGELRETGPGDKIRAGDKLADRVRPRLRAEEGGLGHAARVEKAVREEGTTVWVGGKLDFIDGQEVDLDIARHRLDGANVITRTLRLDLLFAGNKRNVFRPDASDDLVVNLAREQAQRQPDETALMTKHTLD